MYNSVWLCVQGPHSHSTDFHFNQLHRSVSYFRLLISIILCDCVCRGHTAIPQIFTLISYISRLFQTIDKYNSVWLCVQGPYSHPTDFTLISYISELFQSIDRYNSVWLCVQGPYSHLMDFTLISYISELFKYRYRTIMFDDTRFKFNLDSFFLPSKLFSFSILLLLVV